MHFSKFKSVFVFLQWGLHSGMAGKKSIPEVLFFKIEVQGGYYFATEQYTQSKNIYRY